MEYLFIADLHLCAERPETLARFERFLSERAARAAHLYILGDLFDLWIGDDDSTPPGARVSAALATLVRGGTQLWLMHGNRDFLLGDRFCRESGARPLGDPTLIDLYGVPTLLMHGDLLCTDDHDYQAFRRQVRGNEFMRGFLALPLEQRRHQGREYRARSGEANSLKAEAIMDVNPEAVLSHMRSHGATRLIHGHTHRPADHELLLDGKPVTRHVVGDWRAEGAEIVSVTQDGLRRELY